MTRKEKRIRAEHKRLAWKKAICDVLLRALDAGHPTEKAALLSDEFVDRMKRKHPQEKHVIEQSRQEWLREFRQHRKEIRNEIPETDAIRIG